MFITSFVLIDGFYQNSVEIGTTQGIVSTL
jgi:hypothetical protein